MGHEVIVSSYWGLMGSPTQWEGITILPGYGANYCSTSLGGHCQMIKPDLVVTLGDIWVLDPGILRQYPVAHWLPSDCRPMSLADRSCINQSGARLIAMSRWGYDRFCTAGYRPYYIPHGIDTGIFKPAEDRDKAREALGVTGNFVIGINAANNDAIRKALPEQMLAFAKFNVSHPDSLLAIHTGVHQEGGQDIESVADNLGITDKVRVVDQYRYHGGLVTAEDLAEWYQMLDLLSACTYGEGFGVPIIEAQACGVPVVTTDASSMTELNPYGFQVNGEPFWNGVHKGWWIRPSASQLAESFEKAYLSGWHADARLRDFALGYDAEAVSRDHFEPVIKVLLEPA
jgi:glycosyltransferase involved in cell wall biosynthesis